MMNDKKLAVRLYCAGDESKINRLFESAFHIKRSIEEWRWKFQENPLGKSIIVVGELGNKIVAHIAAIPIGIKLGDKTFVCYQSLDSMSDSFVDTRLIFPQVFKRIQEEIKIMRRINFGFPNKKAHDLLTNKRMRGKSIGEIDIFCANISVIVPSRSSIKKREFNLSKVNEFDDRFTCLWEKLSPIYEIAVIRKKQYLNWRYVYKPNNNYKIFSLEDKEIKGYVVLKVFENNGVKIGSIIDYFAFRDPVVVNNILGNVLVYFDSQEVDLVVCYHRDEFLSQSLLKFGFSALPDTDYGAVFSKMWLIGSNFCPKAPDEIFLSSLNWFIMMGDSDWM